MTCRLPPLIRIGGHFVAAGALVILAAVGIALGFAWGAELGANQPTT